MTCGARGARLVVLASLAFAGCSSARDDADASFPQAPLTTVTSRDGKLQVAAFTAPEQPPTRGVIRVKLLVTDAAKGAPVDGLAMDIVPEMPSMGHGTPTVPRVSAQGEGAYLVEDVNLFMAGRWDLRVTITGGQSDAAVVTIDAR